MKFEGVETRARVLEAYLLQYEDPYASSICRRFWIDQVRLCELVK